MGRKHEPTFRVVLTESQNSTKSGKFLEVVGSHDPRHGDPKINSERVTYWLSKGAEPTGVVHNILVDKGILKGKKINVLPKKTVAVKPAEVVQAKVSASEAVTTVEEVV